MGPEIGASKVFEKWWADQNPPFHERLASGSRKEAAWAAWSEVEQRNSRRRESIDEALNTGDGSYRP